MHWDFALILLFFGIAVPLLGRRRVQHLLAAPETTKADRLKLYASTITFQWIAVAVILWRARVHGISTTELGLAVPNIALTAIVSFFLMSLVLTNQIVSLKQLSMQPEQAHGRLQQVAIRIFPRDNTERIAYVVLVTTVAICEEIIYRGFFQRILVSRAGGFVLAGIVGSAAMFAISHLYQGRRGVIATCIVGIIFSSIRAWTGSLFPSVLAHFCADLIVGLMALARIWLAMSQVKQNE
jgi:membrane protease YdiL (CAAX protease family)